MRTVNDEDFAKVSIAFSAKVLKVFKHLAPLCQSLANDKLNDIILKHLMEDQSAEDCVTVKRYAHHFVSEFFHFLLMYGFIDS